MNNLTQPTLSAHSHVEKHRGGSQLIQDIVIGMSDGLTVPFALAAGLSGAVSGNGVIITAGVAEIVAGSIAMGLGGYLAGQTSVEQYDAELRREYDEVARVPEREKAEVREVLADYGLSEAVQLQFVDELARNTDKWVDFMMKFELGLEKPDPNQATKSAITIGGAYILGGMVPLSPYFFTQLPADGLLFSCLTTLLVLFIFGYVKSRATGQPPLAGAVKVTLIGATAAAAAYFVAKSLG
jgi:vacuolar iron transporter family protein